MSNQEQIIASLKVMEQNMRVIAEAILKCRVEATKLNLSESDQDNLCGKPHNNGEETCIECLAIEKNL